MSDNLDDVHTDTDAQLVSMVKQGNFAALRRLREVYTDAFNNAFAKTKGRFLPEWERDQWREDLYDSVVARRLKLYVGPGPLRRWLFVVARHELQSIVRRRMREAEHFPAAPGVDVKDAVDGEGQPWELLGSREILQFLLDVSQRALSELRRAAPHAAEVLVDTLIQGRTDVDVGRQLGVHSATIARRREKALERFGAILKAIWDADRLPSLWLEATSDHCDSRGIGQFSERLLLNMQDLRGVLNVKALDFEGSRRQGTAKPPEPES